jgi:hypothetical protein
MVLALATVRIIASPNSENIKLTPDTSVVSKLQLYHQYTAFGLEPDCFVESRPDNINAPVVSITVPGCHNQSPGPVGVTTL